MELKHRLESLEVVDATREKVATSYSFTATERRVAVLAAAMPVLTVTAWHTPARPATMVAVTCVSLWLLAAVHGRTGAVLSPVRASHAGAGALLAGVILLMTSYVVAWTVTSTSVILLCAVSAAAGMAVLCRWPARRLDGVARDAAEQERAQTRSGALDPALTQPGTLAVATLLDFFRWVPGSAPVVTLGLQEEAAADHLGVLARAGHVRIDGRATRELAKVRVRLTDSGRSALRRHLAALRRELSDDV